MIIVLNKQIEPGDKERIVGYLKEKGFRIREIQGESDTVLGAVGSAAVDHNEIRVLPGVAESDEGLCVSNRLTSHWRKCASLPVMGSRSRNGR